MQLGLRRLAASETPRVTEAGPAAAFGTPIRSGRHDDHRGESLVGTGRVRALLAHPELVGEYALAGDAVLVVADP